MFFARSRRAASSSGEEGIRVIISSCSVSSGAVTMGNTFASFCICFHLHGCIDVAEHVACRKPGRALPDQFSETAVAACTPGGLADPAIVRCVPRPVTKLENGFNGGWLVRRAFYP